MSSNPTVAVQQVRKPYTITKQRERWTEEEHVKFVEALQLFGRGWRKIEEHIGTKTAVQIRSHAQKFFSKVERDKGAPGQHIEIPPPRPKRKPSHPYPKKAGLSSPEKEDTAPSHQLDEHSTKTAAPKGLKLFGKTVLVGEATSHSWEDDHGQQAKDASSSREDESGVESGGSDLRRTKCETEDTTRLLLSARNQLLSEVSSRNQEQQSVEEQQQQQFPTRLIPLTDPIAVNKLIVLHYATFLAGIHPQVGQVDPWQLLTPQVLKPQQEIFRWQSMTDSNSPRWDSSKYSKKSDSDEEEVIQAGSPNKRRRQTFALEEKSSSSSSTSSLFHGDDEAGSCTQKRSPTISSSYGSSRGGFVPYKRPSAAVDDAQRPERRW